MDNPWALRDWHILLHSIPRLGQVGGAQFALGLDGKAGAVVGASIVERGLPQPRSAVPLRLDGPNPTVGPFHAAARTFRSGSLASPATSARVSRPYPRSGGSPGIVLKDRISVENAAPSLGHTVGHNSALLVLDAPERPVHACRFHGEHQQQYGNARIQHDLPPHDPAQNAK